MRKATLETTIKWLKMINIKDCVKNNCPCADKLRKLTSKVPAL